MSLTRNKPQSLKLYLNFLCDLKKKCLAFFCLVGLFVLVFWFVFPFLLKTKTKQQTQKPKTKNPTTQQALDMLSVVSDPDDLPNLLLSRVSS